MLKVGSRLGAYEVLGSLGAGGMGEVYRAKDTRLKREVAFKVLPLDVAADPERLARFQREAEVLASLNHPHIAHLHGVEDAPGPGESGPVRALVMELVEGPTLADRLARGAVPVREAIAIACQLADALEYAHAHGIVHRDLKPANIKVSGGGPDEMSIVKVLDFGLAKALDPAAATGEPGNGALANSPTITSPAMTMRGAILGSAAYMAPEQARGAAVDKRVDIWAFGVVLYEMLTGVRLFEGESTSDTIAAVLRADPNWSRLPTDTPPALRTLLRRCLERDRRRRLQDIGDARIELDDVLLGRDVEPTAVSPPSGRLGASTAWAVAALLAIVLVVLGWRLWTLPAARPLAIRLDLVTPPGLTYSELSPDGTHMAFIADRDGQPTLHLRDLRGEAGVAAPVVGTGSASHLFWAPDGRAIGFFADGRMKRVDVGTGAVRDLASAPNGRGGTWSPDGTTVLFAPGPGGVQPASLWRVPSAGGEAVQVTTLQPGENQHRLPRFLGEGTRFFFTVVADGLSGDPPGGIYLSDLDGTPPVRLTGGLGHAAWLPPDRVVYFVPTDLGANIGRLVTQPIDLRTGRLAGAPNTIAPDVTGGPQGGNYSLSRAGDVLAFQRPPARSETQLQWYSRSGPAERVGPTYDSRPGGHVALSPDGHRAAVTRAVNGNTDVYVVDTRSGKAMRVTTDPAPDGEPTWSSDGRSLFFASTRDGVQAIWRKTVGDDAPETRVTDHHLPRPVQAWRNRLLFVGQQPGTVNDLWLLSLDERAGPTAVVAERHSEQHGQIAPDGEWLAYTSLETTGMAIWLRRLNGPGRGRQIAEGTLPRWSRDGRELFYVSRDRRLMAMPVTTRADGFDPGTPVPLFSPRLPGFEGNNLRSSYDVSPDGRFLVNVDLTEESPITVVLNWFDELRQRAPIK